MPTRPSVSPNTKRKVCLSTSPPGRPSSKVARPLRARSAVRRACNGAPLTTRVLQGACMGASRVSISGSQPHGAGGASCTRKRSRRAAGRGSAPAALAAPRTQPPSARAASPEGAEARVLGRGDVQRPAHLRSRGGDREAPVQGLARARARPASARGPEQTRREACRAGARPAVHAVRADDDLGGKVRAVEELQRCLVCARQPRGAAQRDPCPCWARPMHLLRPARQDATVRHGKT